MKIVFMLALLAGLVAMLDARTISGKLILSLAVERALYAMRCPSVCLFVCLFVCSFVTNAY